MLSAFSWSSRFEQSDPFGVSGLPVASPLVCENMLEVILTFSSVRRFYFMCMGVCLYVYVCTMCMLDASGGHKRVLGPLELELQML